MRATRVLNNNAVLVEDLRSLEILRRLVDAVQGKGLKVRAPRAAGSKAAQAEPAATE